MPKPMRVWMNGPSVEEVQKRAASKYGYDNVIVNIQLSKEKPPKSAFLRGNVNRYKVFLKKK